jgi:hypothetical protein
MGGAITVCPGKMSLISLKIGSTRTLPSAPTVVRIVGTPRSHAARARLAVLATTRAGSVERTFKATKGW